MNRYQNVRTGTVIDIPSKLNDPEWEPVKAPAPPQNDGSQKAIAKAEAKKASASSAKTKTASTGKTAARRTSK